MSDPVTDRLVGLAELDTERLGVHPAPASDVRARGDQHRRRRYAATSVAAVAAVMVIGIGAKLVGSSGPRDLEPAPSPSPTTATTGITGEPSTEPTPSATEPPPNLQIPAGFPLSDTYPETNEDGTAVRVSRRPGVGGLTLCGKTILTSTGAADVLGAKYVGAEDFRARTLLLFESPADALDVLQQAERAVTACPAFDEATFTPYEVPLGDASFGFDQAYGTSVGPALGLSSYLVVVVGRAVLIGSAYGEATDSPESRTSFHGLLVDDTRAVVESMVEDLPA